MGQTADQLRQEIDDKRDDAAAKIDEIEARVQNTAQMAKDTVEETMQSAKDTVTETVSETLDTVKQSFDVKRQIDERPLMALGAAALGGFILGGMGGGDKKHRSDRTYSSDRNQYQEHRSQPGRLQQAARSTGLDNAMSAVTGALMGMAADRLRGLVEESFPEFSDRLRREMNTNSGATAKQYGASGAAPGAGTDMAERNYRQPNS